MNERERPAAIERLKQSRDVSVLWETLLLFQAVPFYTAKGLEFTYTIRGGEMFVDRKEKSITRATVELAYRRALALDGVVTGPKKLGVFGASYLYPVFIEIGVIGTVAVLSEEVDSLTQARSAVAANDRTAYIPDLDPHTDGWKVTQFGDPLQSQEMCYTITMDTGLIIIDGGMEYEEDRLRNIIAQYGNCVEAWILTHPHADHITAFMDIYDDPQGIVIHNVYAVEMPDLGTLQASADWDDYTAYERFMEMDIPELTYLHTGDTLSILGLEFEVLSAYSDIVDELPIIC